MPISDPRDRYFYPHHTPMKDTYNTVVDLNPLLYFQGLCSVLDAVCVEGSTILDPHWEHVTNALFPQVKT